MNAIIEKLTGLDKLSDQVIATDLMVSSKCGITEYAVAITETTSPKLRETLVNQLNDIIAAHEKLAEFMMDKGYYHAYDLEEQYQVDMKTTDTALGLKELMK
jgi:similar to spore coat protein